MKQNPLLLTMAGIFATLRVAAVLSLSAESYPDTESYEDLDFTGRATRLWTVPLIYANIQSPEGRVALQVVIAIVAWLILAVVAYRMMESATVGLVMAGLVMALGLTTSVTNWDAAMLSESISLSMAALLIAAWILLMRSPATKPWAAAGVVAASTAFLFTRHSHLAVILLTMAVAIMVAVKTRRAKWALVAAGLIAISSWGIVAHQRNGEIRWTSLALIASGRIAPNADHLEWFRARGMPTPVNIATRETRGPRFYHEVLADRELMTWIKKHGDRAYARFLLEHPRYVASAPFRDLAGKRGLGFALLEDRPITMLSPPEAYGPSRPVLPTPAEELLFDPGRTGGVLFALATLGPLLGWAWKKGGYDRRWTVPLFVLAIDACFAYVIWHGQNGELGRLSMVFAMSLRVALILVFAALADRWLIQRQQGASSG